MFKNYCYINLLDCSFAHFFINLDVLTEMVRTFSCPGSRRAASVQLPRKTISQVTHCLPYGWVGFCGNWVFWALAPPKKN